MTGIDIDRLVAALPPITCPTCGQERPAAEQTCPTCGPSMNGSSGSEVSDHLIGKTGLNIRNVGAAVLADGPVCTGLGASLWYYRRGVWLPGGEAEVYRRTKGLLGNRWRRAHAENLVAWFAADEPFIGDSQPTERINTLSGLLNWRTGSLSPHTSEIPSTFQVPHQWNPDATCPTVDRWLDQVVPADAIDLVWELLGYLLFPDNPLHLSALLHGSGRNGKSTLLALARRLLGAPHVSAVTLQALGENRFAAADLFGKVANLAGDLDSRSILRTDLFKQATGADPISGERKYGQSFTFTCRATFVFAANELPGTADVSEGYFSRWIVVPFTGYFPPGKADPHMRDRLFAELPGVLVKAVAALRTLMARGQFDLPASVADATAEYRRRADPMRQFISERIEVAPDEVRIERPNVYTAYRMWTEFNGYRAVAAAKFYERLLQGVPTARIVTVHGVRYVAGIRLADGDAS
jgi:P4 family phage/plasmid primase-like protien